jgi:hypothetical protein
MVVSDRIHRLYLAELQVREIDGWMKCFKHLRFRLAKSDTLDYQDPLVMYFLA